MSAREKLKAALGEYDAARQYDSDIGEADNAGNDAGDALAELLRTWLRDGRIQ